MIFPRYEINDAIRNRAIKRADEIFDETTVYGYRKTFAGVLGEMAVWQYIEQTAGYAVRSGGRAKHDLEVMGRVVNRIEVKTQLRNVDTRDTFSVNVNKRQYDDQIHDVYVFCSAKQGRTEDTAHMQYIEVVGWCLKEDVARLGTLLMPGQTFQNGQPVKKPVYSLLISQIQPMAKIDRAIK